MKELSIGYDKVEFPNPHHISSNLFKRALELGTTKASQSNKNNKPWRKLVGDETKQVVAVCSMYHAALNTLSQLKLDILSGKFENSVKFISSEVNENNFEGLCYNDTLLHDLFLLLASFGPYCGLKVMLELLGNGISNSTPLMILWLFSDLMTHYVT